MAGKAMDKENRPDDVTQETEVIEEVTTGVESVDDAGNAIVAVDETITPVDGADTGSVGPSVGPATGDDAGGHVAPGSNQEVSASTVAGDLNKQHKDRSRNHRMKSKEDILSFENLRKEHDMVLSFRSVSLMILAIVLCIPWPASFIPLKFLFFLVLSYTAIYNEVMIGDEYAVRQDKSSKWAHVLSYVALGIVALLFVVAAVQVGSEVTSLSNALDQANAHLRAAGLTDQMVIGK